VVVDLLIDCAVSKASLGIVDAIVKGGNVPYQNVPLRIRAHLVKSGPRCTPFDRRAPWRLECHLSETVDTPT